MAERPDATLEDHSYYGDPEVHPLAPDAREPATGTDARVLVFSQRNIAQPVWHGAQYEFEDVVAEVDAARLLTPRRAPAGRGARLVQAFRGVAGGHLLGHSQPESERVAIDGDYDLFFAVFHFAWQLSYLNQFQDWRRRCRKAVCVILEQWLPGIERAAPHLRLLREFDQVFVPSRWTIPPMRAISGRPVDYLATGVDAEASCPWPARPGRTIDVYSMGRYSPVTHHALLELMKADRLTYVFDSVRAGHVRSVAHDEHRPLVRHLTKRSRYFLAYRMNDTEERRARTGGEEAISFRYFEGTAGGAVLLGTAPDCDDYRAHFDWPDATIEIGYETAKIADVLADLDTQPVRLAAARVNNTVAALRRHDWVYRWGTILRSVGLPETAAMHARVARLESLAQLAMRDGGA